MTAGTIKKKTLISPSRDGRPSPIIAALVSFLALLSISLLSCAHQPVQGNRSIKDKIIDAYGGRERIANVRSVASEGWITSFMRGDVGIYRLALRRDRRLFVDMLYGQSTERRLLDGTRGFQGRNSGISEVFGPHYRALQDLYNELTVPFGLTDDTLAVTELRRSTYNGAEVGVIRIGDRAGNDIGAYVSTRDHLIVKCMSIFENGLDFINMSTEFSDFRRVGGVLFPFHMTNYAGGALISEVTITAYLLNEPIDDAFFKP